MRIASIAVTVTSAAAAAAVLGLIYRRPTLRRLRALLSLPTPPPDAALIQRLTTCVFDCDGVIYQHDAAVPGVPEALGKLRSSGQRLIFVTNAAGQSRASLAAKLTKLGVPGVTADDCVTSASAAAAYLATTHPQVKRAYVVGQGGLLDELRLKGIEPVGEKDVGGLEALIASGGLTDDVDAVVVGMQYEGLCYARLAKAAAYARDPQRPFVATNPDANFPAGLADMVPAGGCNVRFVAYAAEREPDVVVGKPSRDLALLLSSLYGLSPDTTLMVGDRINTDVAFGLSVGWRTMLVLSGCHSRADIRRANAAERPDYCADTVADLANLL
jgi:4-nitrophenyl phosphatase